MNMSMAATRIDSRKSFSKATTCSEDSELSAEFVSWLNWTVDSVEELSWEDWEGRFDDQVGSCEGIVRRQRRRQAFSGIVITIESTSKLSPLSTVGATTLGVSSTGEEGRMWEPSVRRNAHMAKKGSTKRCCREASFINLSRA